MTRRRWVLTALAVLAVAAIGIGYYELEISEQDIYVPLFAAHCGDCHGNDLRGTDRGPSLLDGELAGGDAVAALVRSIGHGAPDAGMPAFSGVLSGEEIKGLAIYVGERRLGLRFSDFRYDADVRIPTDPVHSEVHDFYIETFAEGLDPMPFGLAALPDGSFLLTEKERGLSVISPDGVQSAPIEGTPETGGSVDFRGIQLGLGWLLDAVPHPDYEDNGWIYLHYTELCGERCDRPDEWNLLPKSMNRLDRGRIVDGRWVDVENIWHAEPEHYAFSPDTGAGGRIAFDGEGHVFISVGIALDGLEPQLLEAPFGKIHRVNDDGTIPSDNPLLITGRIPADAPFHVQSIWTYGHRSPQGLQWNPRRGAVWEAEMGPRGGDEINELRPGGNYGWPFHSLGLEYSGVTVARHEAEGIEFDLDDVEMPLTHFTPSPAISSFAFYSGDAFPGWQNDVLLGSLKGSSLFRLVFDSDRLVHEETLIKDLARIRDVEIGNDGLVYLLLENEAGSRVVRLVPAADRTAARP
ncbi:MAG TPA: PQQ-dependent sugar dehydrogenase [Pseudomonadales bacterium]